MAERPILFSSPMVRTILDGRKSQTRRVVKPQPSDEFSPSSRLVVGYYPTKVDRHGEEYPGNIVYGVADDSEGYVCPYGVPGDRLWVRETWAEGGRSMQLPCGEFVWSSHRKARYAATDDSIRDVDPSCSWRIRPSIHMPRWASRLTLEIVSVRVERLNQISEGDAKAEGIERLKSGRGWYDPTTSKGAVHLGHYLSTAREAFEILWDSINAKKHPWDSNPWVWVVEFKRLEATDAR